MLASGLVVLLLGASDAVDEARARVLGMPLEDRRQIEENLRRFDQVLTNEQQKAVRELDERLARLAPEERIRYLAVLRRYHNCIDSRPSAGLPEGRSRAQRNAHQDGSQNRRAFIQTEGPGRCREVSSSPDAAFGSQPLLPQPTTPPRRRSGAFDSVLGRDAPLDPG